MKEEIIIINGEPFYRIPNGTSCDYAPIPKEFKPYFEKLEEENERYRELGFKYLNDQNNKLKEVIKEAREQLEKELEYSKTDCVPARRITCEKILEILSKGENK